MLNFTCPALVQVFEAVEAEFESLYRKHVAGRGLTGNAHRWVNHHIQQPYLWCRNKLSQLPHCSARICVQSLCVWAIPHVMRAACSMQHACISMVHMIPTWDGPLPAASMAEHGPRHPPTLEHPQTIYTAAMLHGRHVQQASVRAHMLPCIHGCFALLHMMT